MKPSHPDNRCAPYDERWRIARGSALDRVVRDAIALMDGNRPGINRDGKPTRRLREEQQYKVEIFLANLSSAIASGATAIGFNMTESNNGRTRVKVAKALIAVGVLEHVEDSSHTLVSRLKPGRWLMARFAKHPPSPQDTYVEPGKTRVTLKE